MNAFVADTHAVIWYLAKDKRLSHTARAAFSEAQMGQAQVAIPSIVLVEIIFLAQRKRVGEQAITLLLELTEEPTKGIYIYPLNRAVIQALTHFGPAAIPELADRIIAATARHLGRPLLTVDPAIQASKLVDTVW